MIPTYRILTKRSTREYEEQDELLHIMDEQEDILIAKGVDHYGRMYLIHRFESIFANEETYGEYIENAVESTMQKEGLDLVQFDNGNIGYVGYSHGIEYDAFEILGEYED